MWPPTLAMITDGTQHLPGQCAVGSGTRHPKTRPWGLRVEGIVFMVIGSVWFFFRQRIAAYQLIIITEKFRVLRVRDRAEQARALERIGTLFCALLFGAGAIMVILRLTLT